MTHSSFACVRDNLYIDIAKIIQYKFDDNVSLRWTAKIFLSSAELDELIEQSLYFESKEIQALNFFRLLSGEKMQRLWIFAYPRL